jgi:uncharacterized repeat protein (TIGR02543 family)
MSGFGTGSNSNGQFWFGGNTFPGFLFKKNMGVGGRRSTKFNPGGNIICNSPTYLYNKYKPGAGGIGASSMSNRRAKNRLATVCGPNQCFPCYNTLGQYSNYTHNPNGFVPCPAITSSGSVTPNSTGPYTVTYLGNGSNGGYVPVDGSSPYISGSTVTVLGNTFTRAGYIFAGWSTNSGGTGSDYNGGDLFTINANTTLYAQWIPIIGGDYTLTYNGNGGTGSEPALTTEYPSGTPVTILGNSGSPPLTRSGFQFGGWNTAANGSGTNYVGGDTFNIPSSNTILYANWLISGSPRLIYNSNTVSGGTGTAPVSSGTSYPPYTSVDIVNNTFTNTNGYTFGGWNTVADGSGTYYPAGSEISLPALGTVNLYAQWINPATSYTLTYNGNGSTGGALPSSSGTSYFAGSPANIVGNTGNLTNGSLVFYGWNTATDGTGTSYPAGSNITMNANKTLYAQWVSASPQYTVTYYANGATGGSVPAAPTNYPSGVQVPILNEGSLTRAGYTFLGWNGSPTGIGSIYAPGFTFTSKDATLYANWAPGSPVKYCGGGGSGGSAGTPSVTIQYYFPIAQIVQSSDTITVYTTALLSGSSSNYGTGTAPLGITSIASKTVITSSTIIINTNTSYLNPANDNNYTKTITNGVDSNYWPLGATISNITYSAVDESNSSIPTYNTSTKLCFSSGCGLSANVGSSGSIVTAYSFYNQAFTINFSSGASTFIANSPTNVLYTASTFSINWITAPKDIYPYQDIQDSYNALTAITITPSGGSTYVSPSMPATTVQYNGNGNLGSSGFTTGSIPNPQYFAPYTAVSPTFVTISGNTGAMTKFLAPSTFSGWNTAANGSGTGYAPGVIYNGSSNLILYANWTTPPFTTTGGSVLSYTNSTYVITFTGNGTMTFNSGITMPATVNYLLVCGGGAGGNGGAIGGAGGGGAGGQIIYTTNILGATPTTTLSFTVAAAAASTIGNSTICSGTGITTITASGGARGLNKSGSTGGNGGTGSGGGGNGGNGGTLSGAQGTNGVSGTLVSINATNYYFGGGGAGGNNTTNTPAAPAGGLGGGGGVTTSTGNGGTSTYTLPNGSPQFGSTAGYNNSGGGGAGGNASVSPTSTPGRAGGSGVVVVWFSYP